MQKETDIRPQQYEKTPIYRTSREILVGVRQAVSKMDRLFKYDMGADLARGAKRLLRYAFLAYEEQDNLRLKIAYLKKVRLAAQDLMIDHRVANEITRLPYELYAAQIERIVSIFNQSDNWIAAVTKELEQGSRGQSVPTTEGTACRHLDPHRPKPGKAQEAKAARRGNLFER